CRVAIGPRLKIDLDYAYPRQRTRFDVLDSAAQREEPLEPAGDIRLDLFRRHAVIESRHHDDWNLHCREHVDGHACQTGGAYYCDHQADYDNKVRIANREAGHRYSFTAAMVLILG